MEHLRSYEISVWTLQDSFVTVLKPSNLEFKGQIVDPFMNIKDDGEDTLSLKIPMYIREDNGKMIENPLWYNTRNGTIIADLRKLKVIFNKTTTSEEVFEFLITNVKEEHEGLKKYCEVECEGLAFHELGKQGYKIALEGGDEIDIEQKKYFDGESDYSECPQPTINYWADRVFKNSNWHYSVQMDWSMHDGITHQFYDILNLDSDNYSSFSAEQQNAFNGWRAGNGLRRRDRVYEDSFVSAWKYDEHTDKPTPETITDEREKYRLVEASESNRYNLSQTIAETFQVYCKYKYSYDDNYHIIGREVIFYNNFLNESRGVIDLTYKYNTEHLTRIMDATDTVSKMYVRPLKDGDAPTGEALISDAEANKSKEDYLLNFDYLYNIGTITQEQYDEIEPYYAKLYQKNKELIDIGEKLIIKEKEKIKQEARKTTAEQAMAKDNENISNNDAIARNVTDDEGNVPVTADNAQMLYLIPEGGDKKTYYCNFKSQGIVRNTIHLYWERLQNTTTKKYYMDNEITQYNIENDEFGEVSKVVNIDKDGHDEQSWIYATFSYSPNTYFKKVSEIYGIRLGQDQAIFNDASEQVATLETEITGLTDQQNTLLEEKAKIISDFENTMGPALREGTWQPEDEYSNYGEVYKKEIELKNNDESVDGLLSLGWDSELFDDEQDFHYQYGATLQDRYYPCIEITSTLLEELTGKGDYDITEFLMQLNLIYKNSLEGEDQKIKQYIAINSKMKIAFLRGIKEGTNNYNKVVPVLMITDAATMDREQLDLLRKTAYLTYIIPNTKTGKIDEAVNPNDNKPIKFTIGENGWLFAPPNLSLTDEDLKDYYQEIGKNYEIVYPRFKINSPFVKSPYTMITVKQQSGKTKENEIKWELLANYENFYILPRTSYYTVTIKPETIFSSVDFNLSDTQLPFLKYKIYFVISMSPLAIYLDAVQVLKENSFPKISYEIDVMSVNKEFIYDDYSRLGQIAHINDYEFKFENTMGYISELNLDLDRPWQDKIVIKNYKTKFEDIFSTITAQTEQMKKNSATIAMAASAFNSDGTLGSSILGESLMNAILTRAADNTVDSSVPSPAVEFMKYDPLIRNELRQVYNEAGEVLAAASKSVEAVAALNLKNADILRSFQVNVAENMTPSVFRDNEAGKRHNVSLNSDTEDFKSGDIWARNDGSVYTAIQNSSNVQYDTNEDKLKSVKGWAAIKDGQLAISKISGAAINIDTELGQIQLLAGKTIQLLCAGEIELVSNDVKIIGERNVIIGGPDVTIFSTDTTGENTKGVHIFANKITDTNASKSAVDITGDGVVIGSVGKIDIKSAEGINIFSSDTASTSAIRINRTQGIYLGSTAPIKLFSGEIGSDGSKTSVEINKDRISFGVSNNTDSTTAVDLTKDYIIFGAGSVVNNSSISKNNIGDTQAGVQITKDAIKMASSSANNRSYFVLDNEKIEFGTADSSSTGAFIKLAKSGQVTIGVGGTKVTTDTATGFKSISSSNTSAKFEVYAPNFIVTSDGYLHANAANISGTIRATAGTIGGWSIDSDMLYSGGKTPGTNNLILSKKVSSSTSIGGSSGSLDWMITASTGFGVTIGGALYANNANIKGTITATGGSIGGWTIGQTTQGHSYITTNTSRTTYNSTTSGMTLDVNGIGAYYSTSQYFTLTKAGVLIAYSATISGTITAKSGSFGNGTSSNISIGTSESNKYGNIHSGSKSSFNANSTGFYLGTNGFAIGAYNSNTKRSPFEVDTSGNLYATSAEIKGDITAKTGSFGNGTNNISIGTSGNNNAYGNIHSGSKSFLHANYEGFYLGTDGFSLGVYDSIAGHSSFEVNTSGNLYANNATIMGNITANTGFIGGLTINDNGSLVGVYENDRKITLNKSGIYMSNNSMAMRMLPNGLMINKVSSGGTSEDSDVTIEDSDVIIEIETAPEVNRLFQIMVTDDEFRLYFKKHLIIRSQYSTNYNDETEKWTSTCTTSFNATTSRSLN